MDRPTAEILFSRYHMPIFHFLCRASRDVSLAEDLTQEVFVRVVRGMVTYDARDLDRAWLFRIARRVLLDHRRTQSRHPTVAQQNPESGATGPQLQLLAVGLDQALDALPDVDRDALLMRELGGLGYEEIGALLDLTGDAIRSRIHRARCELRGALHGLLGTHRRRSSKEAAQ